MLALHNAAQSHAFMWCSRATALRLAGSLTGPAETDTGLKFLNKETVAPYVETKTRYEGTSSAVTVVPIKAGTPA